MLVIVRFSKVTQKSRRTMTIPEFAHFDVAARLIGNAERRNPGRLPLKPSSGHGSMIAAAPESAASPDE